MIPLLARPVCARMALAPLSRGLLPCAGARRVAPLRLQALSTSARRQTKPSLPASSVLDAAVPSSSPAPTPSTAPVPAQLSFVDRLPAWAEPAKPYLRLLRLDKPTGSILLFWPCAWSITMACTATAAPVATCAWYLGLFATGAVVMRGAGCIINDMWDSKVDAAVERTKDRPIASGEVTHKAALVFLSTQLALGLAVLTQLNTYSILLGAASLPLVAIYPAMKRYTYYPQVVLGMSFGGWGALLGWAAVTGAVNWAVCAPLYVGSAIYCVAYDTIYAHQDKVDDVKAGVKSTALKWGDRSRPIISGLYGTFVGCLMAAGHAMGAGPLYYAISCLGGAAHLAWQVITVDLDNRADCWAKFVSNGYRTGPIIWLGMVADYLQQVVLPLFGF